MEGEGGGGEGSNWARLYGQRRRESDRCGGIGRDPCIGSVGRQEGRRGLNCLLRDLGLRIAALSVGPPRGVKICIYTVGFRPI